MARPWKTWDQVQKLGSIARAGAPVYASLMAEDEWSPFARENAMYSLEIFSLATRDAFARAPQPLHGIWDSVLLIDLPRPSTNFWPDLQHRTQISVSLSRVHRNAFRSN